MSWTRMNAKMLLVVLALQLSWVVCEDCSEECLRSGQEWREALEDRYRSYTSPFRGDGGDKLLLSPFITNSSIKTARELAKVDAEHMLENISSYSGYITVEEQYNSNLWFWYFPAEEIDWEQAPLVIWLQGGPGASSLFGLFEELGPFSVDEEGNELKVNPHSWHRHHNLLFIDNPVGTGFSFTEDDKGYATNQTMIGKQLYSFIVQFLQLFPELQTVPLFISGESYAGKHIPSFAYQIHKNNPTAELKVNLQGLAIGNGFIDPPTMMAYSKYLYQLGLVDDSQAELMRRYELGCEQAIAKNNYTLAFQYFGGVLGSYITRSKIYNVYNFVYEHDVGIGGPFTKFITRPEIRKALHVGNTEFSSIGKVYTKLIGDFMTSGKHWLEELLEHYRVMLYSGQMDIIVAYPLSIRTYRSLQWSGAEDYLNATRRPWFVGDTVAGYTKRAGNLYEVFIRNAGHMVPTDQPERSLTLLRSFISDTKLQDERPEKNKEKN